MNATLMNFIQPKAISYFTNGNTMDAKLDFLDGRGPQNITIKKGNGFYTWIDKPFQVRQFSSLEQLAWEFELPQALVFTLSTMQSGEVTEKPFMNFELMSKQMNDYKKRTGTNFTPKKKKRK